MAKKTVNVYVAPESCYKGEAVTVNAELKDGTPVYIPDTFLENWAKYAGCVVRGLIVYDNREIAPEGINVKMPEVPDTKWIMGKSDNLVVKEIVFLERETVPVADDSLAARKN